MLNVKNMVGCICWFWGTSRKFKHLGILRKIEQYDGITFGYFDGEHWYQHCEHVRKCELRFFQDHNEKDVYLKGSEVCKILNDWVNYKRSQVGLKPVENFTKPEKYDVL